MIFNPADQRSERFHNVIQEYKFKSNLQKVAKYLENNGTVLSGEILNIMERLIEQAHNSSLLYAKLHGAMCRKRDWGARGAPHTWAEGWPERRESCPEWWERVGVGFAVARAVRVAGWL